MRKQKIQNRKCLYMSALRNKTISRCIHLLFFDFLKFSVLERHVSTGPRMNDVRTDILLFFSDDGKLSRIADKGWSSRFGVKRGANNSSL
jgi:hypothetical protein